MGQQAGDRVRGIGRDRGNAAAGRADRDRHHGRSQHRQAAQASGDARRTRRHVRGRGVQGRRAEKPHVGGEPSQEPAGRGAGRNRLTGTTAHGRRQPTSTRRGGSERSRSGPTTSPTRRRPSVRSRSSCSNRRHSRHPSGRQSQAVRRPAGARRRQRAAADAARRRSRRRRARATVGRHRRRARS